ncbi:MAG: hypothetical protein INQ03_15725 [Candidatus Heimdallarchaeota archaeon]|nr:hypothetical protein [Candidatus Heimdallarchaeota archaeon]
MIKQWRGPNTSPDGSWIRKELDDHAKNTRLIQEYINKQGVKSIQILASNDFRQKVIVGELIRYFREMGMYIVVCLIENIYENEYDLNDLQDSEIDLDPDLLIEYPPDAGYRETKQILEMKRNQVDYLENIYHLLRLTSSNLDVVTHNFAMSGHVIFNLIPMNVGFLNTQIRIVLLLKLLVGLEKLKIQNVLTKEIIFGARGLSKEEINSTQSTLMYESLTHFSKDLRYAKDPIFDSINDIIDEEFLITPVSNLDSSAPLIALYWIKKNLEVGNDNELMDNIALNDLAREAIDIVKNDDSLIPLERIIQSISNLRSNIQRKYLWLSYLSKKLEKVKDFNIYINRYNSMPQFSKNLWSFSLTLDSLEEEKMQYQNVLDQALKLVPNQIFWNQKRINIYIENKEYSKIIGININYFTDIDFILNYIYALVDLAKDKLNTLPMVELDQIRLQLNNVESVFLIKGNLLDLAHEYLTGIAGQIFDYENKIKFYECFADIAAIANEMKIRVTDEFRYEYLIKIIELYIEKDFIEYRFLEYFEAFVIDVFEEEHVNRVGTNIIRYYQYVINHHLTIQNPLIEGIYFTLTFNREFDDLDESYIKSLLVRFENSEFKPKELIQELVEILIEEIGVIEFNRFIQQYDYLNDEYYHYIATKYQLDNNEYVIFPQWNLVREYFDEGFGTTENGLKLLDWYLKRHYLIDASQLFSITRLDYSLVGTGIEYFLLNKTYNQFLNLANSKSPEILYYVTNREQFETIKVEFPEEENVHQLLSQYEVIKNNPEYSSFKNNLVFRENSKNSLIDRVISLFILKDLMYEEELSNEDKIEIIFTPLENTDDFHLDLGIDFEEEKIISDILHTFARAKINMNKKMDNILLTIRDEILSNPLAFEKYAESYIKAVLNQEINKENIQKSLFTLYEFHKRNKGSEGKRNRLNLDILLSLYIYHIHGSEAISDKMKKDTFYLLEVIDFNLFENINVELQILYEYNNIIMAHYMKEARFSELLNYLFFIVLRFLKSFNDEGILRRVILSRYLSEENLRKKNHLIFLLYQIIRLNKILMRKTSNLSTLAYLLNFFSDELPILFRELDQISSDQQLNVHPLFLLFEVYLEGQNAKNKNLLLDKITDIEREILSILASYQELSIEDADKEESKKVEIVEIDENLLGYVINRSSFILYDLLEKLDINFYIYNITYFTVYSIVLVLKESQNLLLHRQYRFKSDRYVDMIEYFLNVYCENPPLHFSNIELIDNAYEALLHYYHAILDDNSVHDIFIQWVKLDLLEKPVIDINKLYFGFDKNDGIFTHVDVDVILDELISLIKNYRALGRDEEKMKRETIRMIRAFKIEEQSEYLYQLDLNILTKEQTLGTITMMKDIKINVNVMLNTEFNENDPIAMYTKVKLELSEIEIRFFEWRMKFKDINALKMDSKGILEYFEETTEFLDEWIEYITKLSQRKDLSNIYVEIVRSMYFILNLINQFFGDDKIFMITKNDLDVRLKIFDILTKPILKLLPEKKTGDEEREKKFFDHMLDRIRNDPAHSIEISYLKAKFEQVLRLIQSFEKIINLDNSEELEELSFEYDLSIYDKFSERFHREFTYSFSLYQVGKIPAAVDRLILFLQIEYAEQKFAVDKNYVDKLWWLAHWLILYQLIDEFDNKIMYKNEIQNDQEIFNSIDFVNKEPPKIKKGSKLALELVNSARVLDDITYLKEETEKLTELYHANSMDLTSFPIHDENLLLQITKLYNMKLEESGRIRRGIVFFQENFDVKITILSILFYNYRFLEFDTQSTIDQFIELSNIFNVFADNQKIDHAHLIYLISINQYYPRIKEISIALLVKQLLDKVPSNVYKIFSYVNAMLFPEYYEQEINFPELSMYNALLELNLNSIFTFDYRKEAYFLLIYKSLEQFTNRVFNKMEKDLKQIVEEQTPFEYRREQIKTLYSNVTFVILDLHVLIEKLEYIIKFHNADKLSVLIKQMKDYSSRITNLIIPYIEIFPLLLTFYHPYQGLLEEIDQIYLYQQPHTQVEIINHYYNLKVNLNTGLNLKTLNFLYNEGIFRCFNREFSQFEMKYHYEAEMQRYHAPLIEFKKKIASRYIEEKKLDSLSNEKQEFYGLYMQNDHNMYTKSILSGYYDLLRKSKREFELPAPSEDLYNDFISEEIKSENFIIGFLPFEKNHHLIHNILDNTLTLYNNFQIRDFDKLLLSIFKFLPWDPEFRLKLESQLQVIEENTKIKKLIKALISFFNFIEMDKFKGNHYEILHIIEIISPVSSSLAILIAKQILNHFDKLSIQGIPILNIQYKIFLLEIRQYQERGGDEFPSRLVNEFERFKKLVANIFNSGSTGELDFSEMDLFKIDAYINLERGNQVTFNNLIEANRDKLFNPGDKIIEKIASIDLLATYLYKHIENSILEGYNNALMEKTVEQFFASISTKQKDFEEYHTIYSKGLTLLYSIDDKDLRVYNDTQFFLFDLLTYKNSVKIWIELLGLFFENIQEKEDKREKIENRNWVFLEIDINLINIIVSKIFNKEYITNDYIKPYKDHIFNLLDSFYPGLMNRITSGYGLTQRGGTFSPLTEGYLFQLIIEKRIEQMQGIDSEEQILGDIVEIAKHVENIIGILKENNYKKVQSFKIDILNKDEELLQLNLLESFFRNFIRIFQNLEKSIYISRRIVGGLELAKLILKMYYTLVIYDFNYDKNEDLLISWIFSLSDFNYKSIHTQSFDWKPIAGWELKHDRSLEYINFYLNHRKPKDYHILDDLNRMVKDVKISEILNQMNRDEEVITHFSAQGCLSLLKFIDKRHQELYSKITMHLFELSQLEDSKWLNEYYYNIIFNNEGEVTTELKLLLVQYIKYRFHDFYYGYIRNYKILLEEIRINLDVFDVKAAQELYFVMLGYNRELISPDINVFPYIQHLINRGVTSFPRFLEIVNMYIQILNAILSGYGSALENITRDHLHFERIQNYDRKFYQVAFDHIINSNGFQLWLTKVLYYMSNWYIFSNSLLDEERDQINTAIINYVANEIEDDEIKSQIHEILINSSLNIKVQSKIGGVYLEADTIGLYLEVLLDSLTEYQPMAYTFANTLVDIINSYFLRIEILEMGMRNCSNNEYMKQDYISANEIRKLFNRISFPSSIDLDSVLIQNTIQEINNINSLIILVKRGMDHWKDNFQILIGCNPRNHKQAESAIPPYCIEKISNSCEINHVYENKWRASLLSSISIGFGDTDIAKIPLMIYENQVIDKEARTISLQFHQFLVSPNWYYVFNRERVQLIPIDFEKVILQNDNKRLILKINIPETVDIDNFELYISNTRSLTKTYQQIREILIKPQVD